MSQRSGEDHSNVVLKIGNDVIIFPIGECSECTEHGNFSFNLIVEWKFICVDRKLHLFYSLMFV